VFTTRLFDNDDFELAIAEAKRRWGPEGSVSFADNWPKARYLVGKLIGPRFIVCGRGSSFGAAFADADARPLAATRRNATR
jgi:hypothetical protein